MRNTSIKTIFPYLSTLIFLFKKMKTFPLIEKDIKASPFSSDDGLLLNKKRKKFQKNNIELSKKHGENSLDYLTKKVLKYIKQSKTDYINLKNIANDIKIQKRRLYDVINVLQGKYNLILFNSYKI